VGLKDELITFTGKVFGSQWKERDGNKVPEDADVGMGNDAVKLDATVLYADLSDSTALVDKYKRPFAAEVYKTFLYCAARLIGSEGGVVTAYDGDRVMAVYFGTNCDPAAARTALKIKWATDEIVNAGIAKQYPSSTYRVKHVVGIDRSDVYVARTGVRGANDLVWVGRAANYAAKLAELPNDYQSYITEDVYKQLSDETRFGTSNGRRTDMWTPLMWTEFNKSRIYGSTWRWAIS